ncbi:hypothetical protein D3C77_570990 [compost metagenome]
MQALAALTVEEQPIKDGEQPGPQRIGVALLVAPAQGSLDRGLHQVVGAARLAGQPHGKAAQAGKQLAPLVVVQIMHGKVPASGAVSVRGRRL